MKIRARSTFSTNFTIVPLLIRLGVCSGLFFCHGQSRNCGLSVALGRQNPVDEPRG